MMSIGVCMTTNDIKNALGGHLPMDESGKKIKQWCIDYIAWDAPKKLLDTQPPTFSAYFIAKTAEEAVAKLLEDLHAFKIDVIGTPRYCPLSLDEYLDG